MALLGIGKTCYSQNSVTIIIPQLKFVSLENMIIPENYCWSEDSDHPEANIKASIGCQGKAFAFRKTSSFIFIHAGHFSLSFRDILCLLPPTEKTNFKP